MFIGIAILLAIIGSVETTPRPDIKNFISVLSKELEFRVDDCKTGFVGRVVDYRNPDDPSEFVRVYYRQVAIVSVRACEKSTTESSKHNADLSNLNYHLKQESETLGRIQQATDAFVYVQWQVVHDQRMGQDIKIGSTHVWLLDPSGVWVYRIQSAGTKNILESAPLTEPSKVNPKKLIIVGIKFTLENTTHIVRIDQDDILSQVKEVANDKK